MRPSRRAKRRSTSRCQPPMQFFENLSPIGFEGVFRETWNCRHVHADRDRAEGRHGPDDASHQPGGRRGCGWQAALLDLDPQGSAAGWSNRWGDFPAVTAIPATRHVSGSACARVECGCPASA